MKRSFRSSIHCRNQYILCSCTAGVLVNFWHSFSLQIQFLNRGHQRNEMLKENMITYIVDYSMKYVILCLIYNIINLLIDLNCLLSFIKCQYEVINKVIENKTPQKSNKTILMKLNESYYNPCFISCLKFIISFGGLRT